MLAATGCAIGLGAISSCSGATEYSMQEYALKTGWYSVVGHHRTSISPDAEPEVVYQDVPIDTYVCLTAQDIRRKSEEEITRAVAANGHEVLEVSISPFEVRVREIIPSNDDIEEAVNLTVMKYDPELTSMTVTIEAQGETDFGVLVTKTQSTSTWISDECPTT